MEEKLVTFKSSIAEITPEDFAHPGLRLVKFVFCDDKPNENGQGIEYEDFAEISKSAIGAPIKMKFFGTTAGGHIGSVPIGFIKNMVEIEEAGVHKLVADAVLFAEEYPDEIDYLITSFAEGNAPGVSWELSYKESIIKEGVHWLKGLLTKAATFVRNPAYGNRTAILALASNKEISDDQLTDALEQLFTNDKPKNTVEGGNISMDEKELQKLQDELASLKVTVEEKKTEIERLTGDLKTATDTVSERDNIISEFKQKELVSARTAALVEAGIALPTDPEKLAAKQEFYASLSEEAFAEYTADLKEALATKKDDKKSALASLNRPPKLPRFAVAEITDERPNLVEMKSKFRNLSRSYASTESE